MDDKKRKQILDILNSIPKDDSKLEQAAAEMAKTTRIMLDAFESEGLDHYDALSIICSIFSSAVMGKE